MVDREVAADADFFSALSFFPFLIFLSCHAERRASRAVCGRGSGAGEGALLIFIFGAVERVSGAVLSGRLQDPLYLL